MDAQCVRNYKALANVERAFRSLKTVDLKVRPIHHRKPDRVRAHILLCMLAYYVEWHMREAWREAWRELMFADTDQASKATRDPVAPAERSRAARAKLATHTLGDGSPAHSFSSLMAELASIVRNTCRAPRAGPDAQTFDVFTTPNVKNFRAFELIQQIRMQTETGTLISLQMLVEQEQTHSRFPQELRARGRRGVRANDDSGARPRRSGSR